MNVNFVQCTTNHKHHQCHLHFNGRFPGKSGLAGSPRTSSPFMLENKPCNKRHMSLMGPSCHQINNVKAGVLPGAKVILRLSLRSFTLAVLLQCTPAAGISEMRLGARNGITELLQMASPIFGWAAITLGIGPHSSFFKISLCFVSCYVLMLMW